MRSVRVSERILSFTFSTLSTKMSQLLVLRHITFIVCSTYVMEHKQVAGRWRCYIAIKISVRSYYVRSSRDLVLYLCCF